MAGAAEAAPAREGGSPVPGVGVSAAGAGAAFGHWAPTEPNGSRASAREPQVMFELLYKWTALDSQETEGLLGILIWYVRLQRPQINIYDEVVSL